MSVPYDIGNPPAAVFKKLHRPNSANRIPAGGSINQNINSYRINATFLVGGGKGANNIISL